MKHHFTPYKSKHFPDFMPTGAVNDNIGVQYKGGVYHISALGLTKEFNSALEAKAFVDFVVNPIPKFFKYELKNLEGQTLVHTNDWSTLKRWYEKYSGRKK